MLDKYSMDRIRQIINNRINDFAANVMPDLVKAIVKAELANQKPVSYPAAAETRTKPAKLKKQTKTIDEE